MQICVISCCALRKDTKESRCAECYKGEQFSLYVNFLKFSKNIVMSINYNRLMLQAIINIQTFSSLPQKFVHAFQGSVEITEATLSILDIKGLIQEIASYTTSEDPESCHGRLRQPDTLKCFLVSLGSCRSSQNLQEAPVSCGGQWQFGEHSSRDHWQATVNLASTQNLPVAGSEDDGSSSAVF